MKISKDQSPAAFDQTVEAFIEWSMNVYRDKSGPVIEIDPSDGEGLRILPVTQILKALSNRHEQLPEAFFKSAPEYDASRFNQRGRSLHGLCDECGILMSEGDTYGTAADKIIGVIEDRIKEEFRMAKFTKDRAKNLRSKIWKQRAFPFHRRHAVALFEKAVSALLEWSDPSNDPEPVPTIEFDPGDKKGPRIITITQVFKWLREMQDPLTATLIADLALIDIELEENTYGCAAHEVFTLIQWDGKDDEDEDE